MQTNTIFRWFLALPRPFKRLLAVLHDAFFSGLTVWFAVCLRLERWAVWNPSYTPAVVGAVGLALPLFAYFGLYRAVFRYAGWHAMLSLIRAIAVYSLAYMVIFTIIGVPGVPRTVGIVQPLLMQIFLRL